MCVGVWRLWECDVLLVCILRAGKNTLTLCEKLVSVLDCVS